MTKKTLSSYIFELQKSGRNTFSRQEALKSCNMSNTAFQAALSNLAKVGQIISPKKEFYVIVPPEYHQRPLPVSLYIDSLMNHLDKPYYVGVLSAAAIHGASHQQPMEFQVVTNSSLRDVVLPGERIHFLTKINFSDIKTTKVKTRTGYMNISTPEVTSLDLIKYIERTGFLDNAVNVLIELSPKLRSRQLAATSKAFESTVIQRLGYLLDTFVEKPQLTQLMWESLIKREPQITPLSLGSKPNKGEVDSKWLVRINETVEPDL